MPSSLGNKNIWANPFVGPLFILYFMKCLKLVSLIMTRTAYIPLISTRVFTFLFWFLFVHYSVLKESQSLRGAFACSSRLPVHRLLHFHKQVWRRLCLWGFCDLVDYLCAGGLGDWQSWRLWWCEFVGWLLGSSPSVSFLNSCLILSQFRWWSCPTRPLRGWPCCEITLRGLAVPNKCILPNFSFFSCFSFILL